MKELNEEIVIFNDILLLKESRANDDDESRAAGCIIVYDGKILLQHRSLTSHCGGSWSCFGGSSKLSENFEQTMYREVEEESGISKNDIENVRPLGRSGERGFTFFTFIAQGKDISNIINIDCESIGYAFLTYEESLRTNLHPAFRETMIIHADIIKSYIEDSKSEVVNSDEKINNSMYINIARDTNHSRFVNDVEFNAVNGKN